MKNPKQTSINEAVNFDDLLEVVTHQMYESICELHTNLSLVVGEQKANDIVVESLGINLGHVIGQLEIKLQKKYTSKTNKTIREHTLLGTIAKDKHIYGSVGSA